MNRVTDHFLARTVVLAGVFLCAFLASAPGAAQANPASLGLAGAFSLSARGVDAPSANPATLDWDRSMQLRFLSATAVVRNNSFTLGEYDRWNGGTWSDTDKRRILDRIDGSTLEGSADARIFLPGVALSGWAFTVETLARGGADLPRESARLILFGNTPEETFRFGRSRGEGLAYTEVRASHALAIGTVGSSSISAGLSVKYLQGWAYAKLLRSEGDLTTTLDAVDGRIELTSRTAEGGNGLALDLGLAAHAAGGWDLGLALRNWPSAIWWGRNPRLRTDRAAADHVTTDDINQADDVVDTASDWRAIGTFRTSLPPELIAAGGVPYGPTYLEIDLRQGLAEGAWVSTTPRLALGVSRRLRSWLLGRTGIAIGGEDGPVAAIGTGLDLGRVRVDLAYQVLGRYQVFGPKGVGAGVAVTYRGPVAASPASGGL